MDYKKYYQEVKLKLEKFSDVIYYEPLSENEIVELEEQIAYSITPLFREFLLAFGFVQDFLPNVHNHREAFIDDCDFIRESLSEYLPIYTDIDKEDVIYLINNLNDEDDSVYIGKINSNDELGAVKRSKQFPQMIEKALNELNTNYSSRCLNSKKVTNTDFTISETDFDRLSISLKEENFKPLSKWEPSDYPDSTMGDLVATYLLWNYEVTVEKRTNEAEYRIEIEEPILTPRSESIILRMNQYLNTNKFKFEKLELKPIELD